MNDLRQFVEVLFYLSFHNKKVGRVESNFLGNLKYDCIIKNNRKV